MPGGHLSQSVHFSHMVADGQAKLMQAGFDWTAANQQALAASRILGTL